MENVPVVGQRVRVVGETGEFMVIRVDRPRKTADLMRMTEIRRVEEGVSLRVIRPVKPEEDHSSRLQQGFKAAKPEAAD
jgi:hypothetical protein